MATIEKYSGKDDLTYRITFMPVLIPKASASATG